MVNLLKRCRFYFAIFVIIAAVVVSLVRGLTPWVAQYQSNVETYLSKVLGHKVVIGTMETGWYWFEPVIKLNDLGVFNQYYSVFEAQNLILGINILSSLWHWQLEPGILYVDQVHLTVRQVDDHWRVDGFAGESTDKTFNISNNPQLLAWLFAEQKLVLKNTTLDIYLKDGTLIPIKDLNLTIHNNYGHYKIKGKIHIEQDRPTAFRLIADVHFNPNALNRTKGEIYLFCHDMQLAQWRNLIQKDRFQIVDGLLTGKIWLTFSKGLITNAQSAINVHSFVGLDTQTKKHLRIDALKGNVAWAKNASGWQLSADALNLIFKGVQWPVNQFLLRYDEAQHNWEFDVQHIVIDSLLDLNWEWPPSVKQWIDAQLHGVLEDTQVRFKANQLSEVLTHFSSLGWNGFQAYPGVGNLSGVFYWRPDGGRLALDGQDTLIRSKGKPVVSFTDVNADMSWHVSDQKWHIDLAHFVLKHPELQLTLQGSLDNPGPAEAREINLTGAVSAEHAQQWITYLPAHRLKPKLDAWLRHDIKQIDKLVADLTVKGHTADFPFDKSPGVFEINSHLQGVDLIFAPNWPLTQHIDAYLKMNKRQLTTDIMKADLQEIPLKALNLRIDDLGLDHETLLVHGSLETNGTKALKYLKASPLVKKLTILNLLKVKGILDLDLQLEAPLYPENDTILTRGDLRFNDTQLVVHHRYSDFVLDHFDGMLAFNERGLLDSHFKAQMMHSPVAIRMHSILDEKPATLVNIQGKFDVDQLQRQFNLPADKLVDGKLSVQSELTIPYQSGELEQVQLKSTLQGVKINAPSPLGKLSELKAPLTVNLDFSTKDALHVSTHYDNRLQSDLWLKEDNGQFVLKGGDIRVGDVPNTTSVTSSASDGVKLIAVLAEVDWSVWKKFFDTISASSPSVKSEEGQNKTTPNNSSLMTWLRGIELKIKQIQLVGQQWNDLSLNAQLAQGEWVIQLNQANIAGTLSYAPNLKRLKGHLTKFYWQKGQPIPNKKTTEFSDLKVSDLPNVDLQIDDFQFKTLNLGALNFKATSKPTTWILDALHLEAPYYSIDMEGDWQQMPAKSATVAAGTAHSTAVPAVNNTHLKAYASIKNLAKSLEQFGITPVVDSKRGAITFEGQWPGGFHDFSLEKIQGQSEITFKEGVISHFDTATEEKLGLGKLLSILSLQTLPRRLKLDFSDLVHTGYDFDIFRGKFDMKQGVMNTTDAFIDGPVASATIKGNLDIVRQLYDVELKISPHITASLPIVATIAGGPLVGAATFVASKILNQTMMKIYAYSYRISGPWKDPVIKQKELFKAN